MRHDPFAHLDLEQIERAERKAPAQLIRSCLVWPSSWSSCAIPSAGFEAGGCMIQGNVEYRPSMYAATGWPSGVNQTSPPLSGRQRASHFDANFISDSRSGPNVDVIRRPSINRMPAVFLTDARSVRPAVPQEPASPSRFDVVIEGPKVSKVKKQVGLRFRTVPMSSPVPGSMKAIGCPGFAKHRPARKTTSVDPRQSPRRPTAGGQSTTLPALMERLVERGSPST